MIFRIGKARYEVGSKLFPVARKSLTRQFTFDNTEPIDNKRLAAVVDKLTYKMGFCYTNMNLLVSQAKAAGVELEFYAGWFFIGERAPIHHAWAVYNQKSVIDPSYSMSETLILDQIDYTKPDWRREAVRLLIRNEKEKSPASVDCVYGKVPVSPIRLIYVGCPDTRINAINIYKRTIAKYPNHPSYKDRGMNSLNGSELQNIYYDMKTKIAGDDY